MKATGVSVRLGVTKNLGNYESMRMDIEMRVDMEPGESAAEAIDKSRDWVSAKLKADVEAHGSKLVK